jgi:cell shape-determining protein MreD
VGLLPVLIFSLVAATVTTLFLRAYWNNLWARTALIVVLVISFGIAVLTGSAVLYTLTCSPVCM